MDIDGALALHGVAERVVGLHVEALATDGRVDHGLQAANALVLLHHGR